MQFMNAFFTEMVLPFLLVFVLVFAILQKAKILGDGKSQIDAMAAFIIGLLSITIAPARNMIVNVMPWMAVGISVILVFMILYGFVAGDLSGKETPKWMKNTFAVLAGVFTLGVVLYVSGWGEWLLDNLESSAGESAFMNVVVIVVIVGVAVVAVMSSGKKKDKKSE